MELTEEEKKQRAKELAKGIAKVSVTKDLKRRCLDMLKADDPTAVVKDNAFAKLATDDDVVRVDGLGILSEPRILLPTNQQA